MRRYSVTMTSEEGGYVVTVAIMRSRAMTPPTSVSVNSSPGVNPAGTARAAPWRS